MSITCRRSDNDFVLVKTYQINVFQDLSPTHPPHLKLIQDHAFQVCLVQDDYRLLDPSKEGIPTGVFCCVCGKGGYGQRPLESTCIRDWYFSSLAPQSLPYPLKWDLIWTGVLNTSGPDSGPDYGPEPEPGPNLFRQRLH